MIKSGWMGGRWRERTRRKPARPSRSYGGILFARAWAATNYLCVVEKYCLYFAGILYIYIYIYIYILRLREIGPRTGIMQSLDMTRHQTLKIGRLYLASKTQCGVSVCGHRERRGSGDRGCSLWAWSDRSDRSGRSGRSGRSELLIKLGTYGNVQSLGPAMVQLFDGVPL